MKKPQLANIIKVVAFIAISAFVVSAAFAFDPLIGIGVLLLSFLALAFWIRADLMAAYANYLYHKDTGKAFLWFERALKTGKLRPHTTLIYAYMLIREGALDKSERLINRILFINRDSLPAEFIPASHLNLSIIKWKRGQLKEAIEELEEVYEGGFRSTVMYSTLGTYYLLNGQYAKALEFNKEAFEYNDTDHSIRDNLALNYYLMGNITSADEMYETLLDEDPTFLEPYYNYGMVLENMAEYEAAMANYEKALALPEKYLSTVTHDQVENAIKALKNKLNAEKGIPTEEAESKQEDVAEIPVAQAEESAEVAESEDSEESASTTDGEQL